MSVNELGQSCAFGNLYSVSTLVGGTRMPIESEKPLFSRRVLAKGAVWAVPAVAAAAAAPVYACSAEPAPESITFTKDYSTCASTVTWTPVKDKTSYQVQYETVDGSTGSETGVSSPLTLTVPGIVKVRVRVHNPPCESVWSQWMSPSNLPQTPQNVKVTRQGTSPYKYTVTWDAVPNATQYHVNGWTLTGGYRDYYTTENQYLKDNSGRPLYRFRVRAFTCGVWSGWSGWYNSGGATSAPW